MRRGKLLLALLAIALLLSGCTDAAVQPDIPPEEEPDRQPVQQPAVNVVEPDAMFSLQYNAGASMDPFVTDDLFNDQVLGLVFEGLFALNEKLVAEPVLCESYDTEDGTRYALTLRRNVFFHDGTALTARDVVYSLNKARQSEKFSQRLSCIESVAEEDGLVTISLRYPNYKLPELLDTPIVQYGTAEGTVPVGTGPYSLDGDRMRLFYRYRTYSSKLPVIIYLVETPVQSLVESFLNRDLDLLALDPTGLIPVNVYAIHETRTYATTDFLYLGFNARRMLTGDWEFRRVVSRLVDRTTICGTIFSGLVEEAPLVLHPALAEYDTAWEADTSYSRQDFMEAARFFGLADLNSDGYLEYDGTVNLKLIVNEDSERKVEAARRIATDLDNMGLRTELSVLPWAQYLSALQRGDFDLYLGETQLKADFDLTALLDIGGVLNYGGLTDDTYGYLIREYQAAATGAERADAARNLCIYARDRAPIVPICYKQYRVLTRVGDITGGSPSQSNIFRDVTGWVFSGFKD